MARRCLGKGTAEDKLVLDTAVWQVLNAEEEKDEVPMEVEEPGPVYVKKETTTISYTRESNGSITSNLEDFNIETKLTYNNDSKTNNFGSSLPSIQPEAIKSKSVFTSNDKPSYCGSLIKSAITGGHGV